MGFLRKMKIAKLMRNGTSQIDAKNYSDAVGNFALARDLTSTEYEELERSIASLPLDEQYSILLRGDGARLGIFFAAAYYGLVLSYLGMGDKKIAEDYLNLLKKWDRESAENLRAKIQNGEQVPSHFPYPVK